MVKQWKLNAHSDKAHKEILNGMHVQIKKQNGVFKDAKGNFVERAKGRCDACEQGTVPVRTLERLVSGYHICSSCSHIFLAADALMLMKKGKY